MIQIKFKKLTATAKTPTRAHESDAGFDFYADEGPLFRGLEQDGDPLSIVYKTGIAVEIPPGYFGAMFARSSIRDTGLSLCNSVGVIDSGYRGEIVFSFYRENGIGCYLHGDKIGQLVILPLPKVELVEVDDLSDSDRGAKGLGSTGR